MRFPHVLSHRGHHRVAPENTLQAFLEASQIGVDGIETDVRCSSDGRPILFHDRIAPDGTPVASLTRRELSTLVGYEVPILNEALDLLPELLWNIEIKTPSAVEITKSAVIKLGGRTRILITSFWHDIPERFADMSQVERGILVAHHPENAQTVPSLFTSRNIDIIVWDYEVLRPSLVQAATKLKVRSWVYGALTPDEHSFCVTCGVAGIITDVPQYAFPEVDHAHSPANLE